MPAARRQPASIKLNRHFAALATEKWWNVPSAAGLPGAGLVREPAKVTDNGITLPRPQTIPSADEKRGNACVCWRKSDDLKSKIYDFSRRVMMIPLAPLPLARLIE